MKPMRVAAWGLGGIIVHARLFTQTGSASVTENPRISVDPNQVFHFTPAPGTIGGKVRKFGLTRVKGPALLSC
jgi:hypothetical protein